MGTAPLVKEDVAFEKLRNIALKNGLENSVETIKERERIILSLNNRVFFNPGSETIDPRNRPFLMDLAEVLKGEGCLIELRGYCAPSEVVFEKDPFKRSTILSAERAFAVLDFLREKGEIPAKRMVAHGFGKNYQGKGKERQKARFSRQVEIILDYRERVPFRVKNSRGKDGLLDFKGFLFKMPADAMP
jgi:chemotaxis protein MotB